MFTRNNGVLGKILNSTSKTLNSRLVNPAVPHFGNYSTLTARLRELAKPESSLFCVSDDENAMPSTKAIYQKIARCDILEAVHHFVHSEAFGGREWHYFAIQKLLNQRNIDVNKIDGNGNNALHLLIKPARSSEYHFHAHSLMTNLLLTAGVDPDCVNDELKTPAHICFELLDHRMGSGRETRVRENVLRQLLQRMEHFNGVDASGWGLLHHALYKKRSDLVQLFLENNPALGKTNTGIEPAHLALYRRDVVCCEKLDSFHVPIPDDIKLLSSGPSSFRLFNNNVRQPHHYLELMQLISPLFYAEMTMKLRSEGWFYWNKLSMFDMKGNCLDGTMRAFRKLYQPAEKLTPMAVAIQRGDLDIINRLILQGWNAYLEMDYPESYLGTVFFESLNQVKGLNNYIAIIQCLSQSESSGVTPDTEFQRLLLAEDGFFSYQKAIALLDMGITPETYLQNTKNDLYTDIKGLGFYDGERGKADCLDFLAYLENRFLEHQSNNRIGL